MLPVEPRDSYVWMSDNKCPRPVKQTLHDCFILFLPRVNENEIWADTEHVVAGISKYISQAGKKLGQIIRMDDWRFVCVHAHSTFKVILVIKVR